nr:hypothetical protein [uncultured Hyphomonas sp.]
MEVVESIRIRGIDLVNVVKPILVERGKHRLIEPLEQLAFVTACVMTSLDLRMGGNGIHQPNDVVELMSLQFDKSISLPVYGPIENVIAGKKAPLIELYERNVPLVAPQTPKPPNIRSEILNIVAPVFTNFYEGNVDWLCTNKGPMNQWPAICPTWNFGRIVRNAVSHGRAINMSSPNAITGTWHHLKYGHADDGKVVIGTELSAADLLFLMLEMSDELDSLGCPI